MTLFWCKIHTAIIVMLTWACGQFVDHSVPYFPIEISRTGTGPISHRIFKWGALSLGASAWYETRAFPEWPTSGGDLTALIAAHALHVLQSPLSVWPWIVVIAWFPDHSHFLVHATGVVGMMLCVLFNVVVVGDTQRRLPLVFCALGIEGARLVMKGFVVLFTEFDNSMWDLRIYWNMLFNVGGLRDAVVKHIMDVMFRGTDYLIAPALTLPLFRVTGVMQWIALYLLMSLY